MLVFNEGVPGAGKTYDSLVTHIFPALKKGRKVYARVNGLDHQAIADYLGMTKADVDLLLVDIDPEQVLQLPGMVETDSLVVIDEAHSFYVASRDPLDSRTEEWFAVHRHHGLDIVLISQWYRRLHSALRARIERKTVFQKLTAVGAKGAYRAVFYQAIGPDRFEVVGAETRRYDKAIYPLYHGVRPDTTNTEVYTAGSKTVWRKLAPLALVMFVLLVFGVYELGHFFFRSAAGVHDLHPRLQVARVESSPPARNHLAPSKSLEPATLLHPSFDTSGMPPGVAYVFSLTSQARPRLAAELKTGQGIYGYVEWRDDQSHVLDRLRFTQLRALGVLVDPRPYGVDLVYRHDVVIVTAWPLDMPGTDAVSNQDQLSAQPSASSASVPAPVVSSSPSSPWPTSSMRRDYVPPQLMPPLTLSAGSAPM